MNTALKPTAKKAISHAQANADVSREVLDRVSQMRSEALNAFYIGKAIGRSGSGHAEDVRHDLGMIQRTLQSAIILDVLRILEQNSRYQQNTLSFAIAAMPDDPSQWRGLHNASRPLRIKKPSVDIVRAKLEGMVARKRLTASYDSLKTIRDKLLAHSERFNHASMNPVTWNNVLTLIRFIDLMIKKMHLICFDTAYILADWPTHAGKPIQRLLKRRVKD